MLGTSTPTTRIFMGTGNRVLSLDLARGLAVAFMVFVHVLGAYASPEVKQSLFGAIIEFLGSPPAAPVFMALMGVSAYYSRKQDLRTGIRRGVTIILLGYLLNLLRGVAPVALARWCAPGAYAGIPAEVADLGDALLALDILHFAGLSLLAMAFIRHWQVDRRILLVLAAAIAAASPWLWGVGCDLPVAGRLLDYLWGDRPAQEECIGNLISFPFFPWFSFVLVGMALGDAMTRSGDARRTLLRAGAWGAGLMAVSLAVIWRDWAFQWNDYYHCRPGAVAFITGFLLAWVALCQLAIDRLPMNRFFTICFDWSRYVNPIYIIQWVLVMWGAVFVFGFDRLGLGATAALMVAWLVAADLINRGWQRLQERRAVVQPPKRER
jgi:uncharacterized membrane protein